jgi:stage II sporulation protein D
MFPTEPDIRVRILESQSQIVMQSADGFRLRVDGAEVSAGTELFISGSSSAATGSAGAPSEYEEGVEVQVGTKSDVDTAQVYPPDPGLAKVQITDSNGNRWLAADVWIESAGEEFIIRDVPFGVGWWWGGKEHRTYEGLLHVYAESGRARLDAVLHLPMETYLKGVIPYEIGPDSPLEALRAQAVAARSEIVQTMITGKYRGEHHDVCADVECQVFAGNIRRSARSDSAVTLTRGEVLLYESDVIDAYYASNCGGMSEVVEKVWPWRGGPKPYLIAQFDGPGIAPANPQQELDAWLDSPPDSWCNPYVHTDLPSWSKANFRWTREVRWQDFSQGFDRVDSLVVAERGASGRIHRLHVWQAGNATELDFELAVRQMVHPPLRSSAFRWNQTETGIVFEGAGWGHGVGMCQSGAVAQAISGRTYETILNHYFPGTRLHSVLPT